MQTDRILISLAGVMLAAAVAWPLQAAGRVQLELIGEARGSSLAFQEWARVLSQAGIRNVRIRSGRATDRVGLEVRGTDENPLYVVTGIVKSRDELLLPAGRFTRRDVGRLARWLEDLAQHVVHMVNETYGLDVFSSVPCTSIAIREFIKMDTGFTAFWGNTPINPERRYFINKGEVVCRHPYWIKEAIREPSIADWEAALDRMNREEKDEIELLTKYTSTIGEVFKDYWSIDFCKAKTDTSVAIANEYECRKAELTPPFDNLRAAINLHYVVFGAISAFVSSSERHLVLLLCVLIRFWPADLRAITRPN